MGAEQAQPLNRLFLCLFLIGSIIIAVKLRPSHRMINFFIAIGLIFQFLLFIWYMQDMDLLIQEGLPLYHCRIVTLGLGVLWWIKDYQTSRILAFLGLIGAAVAFMVPDASPYTWPHITVLTFVGYHLNMSVLSVLILRKTSEVSLKIRQITALVFAMNAFIFMVDVVVGANYGYLMHLPESLNQHVPPFILYMSISILIILMIGISELVSQMIYKKNKNKSQM